jgi:hypothetical protein
MKQNYYSHYNRKYKLSNNMRGGAKAEIDKINQFINDKTNYDKVTNKDVITIMGIVNIDDFADKLVKEGVIEDAHQDDFKNNIKKATIARAIWFNQTLEKISILSEMTMTDTDKINAIYRDIGESFDDETNTATIQSDECADKILFTVTLGYEEPKGTVQDKATAYVIEENTFKGLNLIAPQFNTGTGSDDGKNKIENVGQLKNELQKVFNDDKVDLSNLDINKITDDEIGALEIKPQNDIDTLNDFNLDLLRDKYTLLLTEIAAVSEKLASNNTTMNDFDLVVLQDKYTYLMVSIIKTCPK